MFDYNSQKIPPQYETNLVNFFSLKKAAEAISTSVSTSLNSEVGITSNFN